MSEIAASTSNPPLDNDSADEFVDEEILGDDDEGSAAVGVKMSKPKSMSTALTKDERASVQNQGEAYYAVKNSMAKKEFREDLLRAVVKGRPKNTVTPEMQEALRWVRF